MLRQLHSLGLAMAAFAIFSLTACDQLAAQLGPTRQFVLQINSDEAEPYAGDDATIATLVDGSIPVLTRRLEAMDIVVVSAAKQGADRIVIDLVGNNSRAALEVALGRSGKLDFKKVDMSALPADTERGIAPPGSTVLPMADGSGRIAVRRLGGISGNHIIDASPIFDPYNDSPAIALRFDPQGTRKLATLTSENVGQPMAVVIDDEVITAPIINEPVLGGQVQLSGDFTQESANELAIMLRSGALPIAFTIIEERKLD